MSQGVDTEMECSDLANSQKILLSVKLYNLFNGAVLIFLFASRLRFDVVLQDKDAKTAVPPSR